MGNTLEVPFLGYMVYHPKLYPLIFTSSFPSATTEEVAELWCHATHMGGNVVQYDRIVQRCIEQQTLRFRITIFGFPFIYVTFLPGFVFFLPASGIKPSIIS